MSVEHFDASQQASGTAANNESKARIALLKQLYFTNYSTLTTTAYEAYSGLLVFDCDRILETLATRLPRYKGPSTDEAFLKWATRFVMKEAGRYRFLAMVVTDYSRVIYKAIYENLWVDSVENCAVGHDDVFAEVLVLVFNMAHSLNRKSPTGAKLSTRLYGLAKKHTHDYHNKKNIGRQNALKKRIERGLPPMKDVEVLSAAELASMKADSTWDAGYGEVGLSPF